MMPSISCIIVDDEPTAREILKIHLSKIARVELVAVCKNATEAFEAISSQPIDLIFLDIHLPGISGLSFAKSISKQQKIIFTTAHREFAVDGFELRAVDYLLKPISLERLLQAMESYSLLQPAGIPSPTLALPPQKETFLFVRANRKMVKVIFSEILYIESLGDYLKIHLPQQCVVTRQTLSSIEVQLPPQQFKRIHRSFIVNLQAVDSFSKEAVEIQQQSLPISRGYKKEVLACLEGMG